MFEVALNLHWWYRVAATRYFFCAYIIFCSSSSFFYCCLDVISILFIVLFSFMPLIYNPSNITIGTVLCGTKYAKYTLGTLSTVPNVKNAAKSKMLEVGKNGIKHDFVLFKLYTYSTLSI